MAIAARPLPLPAEAKAFVVGAFAVPGCFWLDSLIIERTRLGRLL